MILNIYNTVFKFKGDFFLNVNKFSRNNLSDGGDKGHQVSTVAQKDGIRQVISLIKKRVHSD